MDTLLTIALAMMTASLAALFLAGAYRLLRGPSPLDRVVGFDATALALVGLMIEESLRTDTDLFIELVFLFSLFGFLGTAALVLYLFNHRRFDRPHPAEPERKAGA